MQNNIPKILKFLNTLPKLGKDSQVPQIKKGKITKEDIDHLEIMLNNATDPKSQAERKALRQYILSIEFQDSAEITDDDREAIRAHLRKYAPEFYRLVAKRK